MSRPRVLPRWPDRPVVVECRVERRDAEALLALPVYRSAFRFTLGDWVVTGWDPRLALAGWGDRWEIRGRGEPVRHVRTPPWPVLDELEQVVRPAPARLPFSGGPLGYLGYGLRKSIERVPDRNPADVILPDVWLVVPDRLWILPPEGGRGWAIEWVPPGHSRARAARALAERRWWPRPGRSRCARRAAPPRSNLRRSEYLHAVRRILEYIRAGDVYQVNYSQRFRVPLTGHPGEAFRDLTRVNPAPFAGYFALPWGAVASVSPERFLRIAGERIVTEPIKGTRPRGRTAAADRAAAMELRASAKDRAELAMIVDLERNDLGRVCRYGSVRVTDACRLESHPTVHHLAATVEGRLRPRTRLSEVIRATFPGGSVTGAPKIRAMEIIDELEPTARGPYTGALGAFGADGRMELSVGIRMLLAGEGGMVYPVGGGIVIESDPAQEYLETLAKGAAQARVLTRRG